ncbi:MFS general substrate transporter [Atractiella rhizophila]|nr:MFS general substrate transporter [Atractiella rhizophila]
MAYPPTSPAPPTKVAIQEEDMAHHAYEDVEAEADGEEVISALDATIDDIGMGRYQQRLLVLCGFGWMADNMWLQCVSIILPRVQDEWSLPERYVGLLSSATFAGMMLGAWGWGSFSDSYGRTPAFNGTLLLTAVFGLLAGYAPNFGSLCASMFCLGTGIGGSMPTDGTLFLENIPKAKAYLLTGLSVFFSVGAVLSSVLGYIIIPPHSCSKVADVPCNVQVENIGWRSLLRWLGIITFVMLFARLALFKLEESPKFLVSTGRADEAILVLRRICHYNGITAPSSVHDIKDEGSTFASIPVEGEGGYTALPTEEEVRNVRAERRARIGSSSELLTRKKMGGKGSVFLQRVEELLEGRWRRVTFFVWAIWTAVSAGFTIFNGFLPSYLERKVIDLDPSSNTLEETLRDSVIYTASGLPGAIVGAYLVEGSLGRRGSMFWSTVLTAAAALSFALVRSAFWIVFTTIVFSFGATIMWAVLYSWTPQLFETRTRGTACGIASALNRLAGIIAPILTGALLEISLVAPLAVSTATLALAGVLMLGLPENMEY